MAEQKSTVALGSRIVVSIVFIALGLSFVAETALMAWEYRMPLALPMAAFDSHLFIFFPVFGLIALFAFWRAATVLVDAYWRYVRVGKLVLFVGLAIGIGVSVYMTTLFQESANRQWWEVARPALMADTGEPAGCRPPNCARAPILEAYGAVRLQARAETGFTGLVDSCQDENMSVFRPTEDRINFCFVTGAPETVSACCAAKERFKAAVSVLQVESPSLTYRVHHLLLPFKIFFLLMLLGIGVMLARRRRVLEAHYPRIMEHVERTIPIGGLSMMLWPLMNHAFTRSFDLLYGAGAQGAFRVSAPLYTLAFGGWAMILMFYYFRRYPEATERAAKLIGALLAGFSILNYDAILAWVNRFLGAGANVVSITVMLVIAVFLAWETLFHGEDDSAAVPEPTDGGA